MKKFVSALLVCFLLVGSMFALVSCGGTKIANGTYESEYATVVVKGDEFKFVYDMTDMGLDELGAEGSMEIIFTYEIKADEAEDAEEGAEVLVLTYKDSKLDFDIPGLEGEEKETVESMINGMMDGMIEGAKEEMSEPVPFKLTDNGFEVDDMEFTLKK